MYYIQQLPYMHHANPNRTHREPTQRAYQVEVAKVVIALSIGVRQEVNRILAHGADPN